MKNNFKTIIAFFAIAVTVLSCSKNETPIDDGVGKLKIEFENGFKNNSIIIGAATVPTSQNEVLKITNLKYIVSNIVLTKTDGSTFVYPKSQSYFIIDLLKSTSLLINLNNIPIGDYKTLKFGIGVDPAQYALGASGQGDFWAVAQAASMTWNWASGYKFLLFEGTFTSPVVSNDTSFMIHTGKTGTDYNYAEIVLSLPTNALVRTAITPQIHLSTDASTIIDGINKISLSANNTNGLGTMIMGGLNLSLITSNLALMFDVEHVHNDPN